MKSARLTDVFGVFLHDVGLQQVVCEHEGALFNGVQQHGGGTQLISARQLHPRRPRLRLQQVIHRLHHRLRPKQTS